MSRLDPSNGYAELGLGLLAQKRKRWREAEQHLKTALARDNSLLDAQRALGDVLAKLGRTSEAILACEQTLNLGLTGRKPLAGPILTYPNPTGRALFEPWHFATHARLAALHAQEGDTQKAIGGLRFSIAAGVDSVGLRLQLARLYWQQGQWRELAAQCRHAIKLVSQGTYFSGRRHLQHALQVAERFWTFANGR